MKGIIIVLTVFSLPCSGFADNLKFKTIVLDGDTQIPISNVVVEASFQNNTFLWNDPIKYDEKVGVTDADGIFRFQGRTNCGIVTCVINDFSGYYDARPVRLYGDRGKCEGVAVSMIRFFVPKRWTVTNDVRFVLRKVGSPIPLKAKSVKRWCAEGLYPEGTNTLAYDLMSGDWLPPLGKGTFADIELVHRRIDRGVGILYDGSATNRIWRDEVEMRFNGDGNGLVGYVSDPSETLRVRIAPESGYRPSHVIWAEKDANLRYSSSEDRNQSFAFRIRTRRDDCGEIIEAFHGKIYGNPNLIDGGGYPLLGFEMTYYLNPVSLDRNLEWDRKNNGFRGECPHYRLP